MLRSQFLVLLAISASAAVLPPTLQEYARQKDPTVWQPPADAEIWKEYGLVEAERAEYKSSGKPFTLTAWRMQDSTGALAAFQWQRPADATPMKGLLYGAQFRTGVIAAEGNYLLRVDGYRPTPSELRVFFHDLPEFGGGSLPTLPTYLPSQKTPNSDRYILGQITLERFLPGWTANQFGLDLGAEGQVAQVGKNRMAIIRYPTPHIARLKLAEFGQNPEVATHRSGPLVAVLFASDGAKPDPKDAESIFKQIEFRATVTENEANPNQPVKDAANMLLSIFTLAGGLLGICLAGGLVMGGIRIMTRRGTGGTGDPIQMLHLGDR